MNIHRILFIVAKNKTKHDDEMMNKENLVYPYKRILLKTKRNEVQSIDACYNMDEF